MRTPILAVLVLMVASAAGCAAQRPSETPEPVAITRLDIDQLNKLLPYMDGKKKLGDARRETIEMSVAGQPMVMYQNTQAFTFSLWLDGKGNVVMPPKGGGSSAALKPTQHHGTFEISCIGGCVPNTSGGPPCVLHGCEAISDDTCGCTPIDCPSCESIGCKTSGWGALGGKLVMA